MIGEVGAKGKPYWKAEVLKFLASDFIDHFPKSAQECNFI
jgi:hypothetical protein